MLKKYEKKKENFYRHYQTIDEDNDFNCLQSFFAKAYRDALDKKIITREEYESFCETIKDSLSTNFKKNDEYAESIKAYDDIIDSTTKLCFELGINDSMDVFTLFDYLLWNGYFSKDKSYIFSSLGRKNVPGCCGLDVINGKGVCLNNSDILNSLLRKMNFESYVIFNKPDRNLKRFYKPDIKRNVDKKESASLFLIKTLCKPLTKIIGNHACVLINKNGLYEIYDPTNLCTFKLDDFLRASIIGGKGGMDIKPYSLSLFSNLNNKKIVEIVESYENISSDVHFSDLDNVTTSFENSIELCKRNTGLLDDFHAENEENRSKVLKIFDN